MKNFVFIFILLYSNYEFSQVDYSNSWEDFYSYNNVKQFTKVDNVIYALTDNAVFTYDEFTGETTKISSVQGLSGETTSALYFSDEFDRLVIGYENGLLEIIDENGNIIIASDIVNFNQAGEKRINHISSNNDILYLSTPFAIVEYDIERLEFGDTFFIGSGSTPLQINETLVLENTIYAVTENGIFLADVTSNLLIDFNNWTPLFSGRNFTNLVAFNNNIYVSEESSLFELSDVNNLIVRANYSQKIKNINSEGDLLALSFENQAIYLNSNLNEVANVSANEAFNFIINDAFSFESTIYLATQEYGILRSSLEDPLDFQEIHPEGPLYNDVFSIGTRGKNLWIVYGGYDITYTPLQRRRGFSHFNGETWINQRFDPDFPVIDLNYVSIDPNNNNRAYLSSFGDTRNINSFSTGGLLVVEDDEITNFYNHLNSTLEDIVPEDPNRVTVRVSGTEFDDDGNLWVANINFNEELKKLSPSGQWSTYDLSDLKTVPNQLGLSEIAIDRRNSIWMGTRRNGLFVFNENGNQKRVLLTAPNEGNLPDTDILSVAIDQNNRVWIGTRSGMVVLSSASSVFDNDVINARPVVIEENGIGERLLGDQRINTIAVDGANNKWFGTENGGVLYTNPSGRTTIANFNKQNSPLPSNRILKIRIDENSGKVFIATDKGVVGYDSDVAPFGESLGEVYAFPNPVLKIHDQVTIDGRNGTNLPEGTNVKILDVSGNLVYESNVLQGQQLQGGKVIWNKTNLAGQRVASGIYIVLLSNDDGSETATTKIAIVN